MKHKPCQHSDIKLSERSRDFLAEKVIHDPLFYAKHVEILVASQDCAYDFVVDTCLNPGQKRLLNLLAILTIKA